MQTHINKIKIYFILVCTAMLMLMVFGIFALQARGHFFTFETIGSYMRFITYKAEYVVKENNYSLLALASAPFQTRVEFEPKEAAGTIPVLVYHGITPEDDGSNINSTLKVFKDHMFALKRAGYETVTLDELYKFLRGEITLPEKSFVITFDDGRSDSFYLGDPVLHALGYNAVMFAISQYSVDIRSVYYLTKEELRAIEATGRWEVEAHTHAGHDVFPTDATGENEGPFFSNKLWLPEEGRLETDEEFELRIRADMLTVKEKLQTTLDTGITSFALPFGDYGQYETNFPGAEEIVLRTAKDIFSMIFYQGAPGIRFTANAQGSKNAESFLVRRINTKPYWSTEELLDIVTVSQEKELPWEDTFSQGNTGWVSSWGTFTIDPGSMTIYPNRASQNGGAAILDGTRTWQDYKVSATVHVPQQNNAFLWVRFQNDNNNAACNFGKGFAHVEQIVDGEKRIIKGARSPTLTLPEKFEVTAEVVDRTLRCGINGEILVESSFLDPSLDRGGIGFKTWDQVNQSVLTVDRVTVQEIQETSSAQ